MEIAFVWTIVGNMSLSTAAVALHAGVSIVPITLYSFHTRISKNRESR